MIGKTFGNYQILSELGRGAMGIVYKAHQMSLNRLVALKILNPALSYDEELLERFMREAQSMARLSHPHIVQIYDTGQENEFYYYAAEFVYLPGLGADNCANRAVGRP